MKTVASCIFSLLRQKRFCLRQRKRMLALIWQPQFCRLRIQYSVLFLQMPSRASLKTFPSTPVHNIPSTKRFLRIAGGISAHRVALDMLLMAHVFTDTFFISWTRNVFFTRRATRPLDDACTHSFLLRCHLSCSKLLGRVTCPVLQRLYHFLLSVSFYWKIFPNRFCVLTASVIRSAVNGSHLW